MKNKKLRALKEFYVENSLDFEGYGFEYVKDLSLKDLDNLDTWLLELGEVYNYISSSIIDLYRELGKVEYCEYKLSDYFLSNDNIKDAIKILDPYNGGCNVEYIWYEMLSKYAFLEDYENVTNEYEYLERSCWDSCVECGEWQEYINLTNINKRDLKEELEELERHTSEEIETILNDCWFKGE